MAVMGIYATGIIHSRGDNSKITCYRCGKQFVCYNKEDWAYAGRAHGAKRYFCTWTCFNRTETEPDIRKAKRA